MNQDRLYEGDAVVRCLWSAYKDGESGLSHVPGLIKRLLKEELWRERRVPELTFDPIVKFDRFEDFVKEPPMRGLGADVPLLQRICADDIEASSLLTQALEGKRGGANNPDGRNQYSEDNDNNVNNDQKRESPVGNTSAAALRRLRKQRPDLHERVLDRKLSPHAAMIEAGFRKATLTAPSDPEDLARYLKRRFTPDELALLLNVLRQP